MVTKALIAGTAYSFRILLVQASELPTIRLEHNRASAAKLIQPRSLSQQLAHRIYSDNNGGHEDVDDCVMLCIVSVSVGSVKLNNSRVKSLMSEQW